MKRILFVLVACFMFSCETENAKITSTEIKVDGRIFTILEMDGCEYIGLSIGNQNGLLTHRGKCKFCKERQIKVIDSLIKANDR